VGEGRGLRLAQVQKEKGFDVREEGEAAIGTADSAKRKGGEYEFARIAKKERKKGRLKREDPFAPTLREAACGRPQAPKEKGRPPGGRGREGTKQLAILRNADSMAKGGKKGEVGVSRSKKRRLIEGLYDAAVLFWRRRGKETLSYGKERKERYLSSSHGGGERKNRLPLFGTGEKKARPLLPHGKRKRWTRRRLKVD